MAGGPEPPPHAAPPPFSFRPALSLNINVSGVYISYPFCAQKCTYCNFASGVFPRDLEVRYREALAREIRAHAWDWTPDTVYLGGGTPSNLAPDALAARCSLSSPDVPGRKPPSKPLPATSRPMPRAPGPTPASTASPSACNRSSKRNSAAPAARTPRRSWPREIAVLHAAGIHNINIDLIAGLSGQTEASWRESLDWVERLAPEHVSVYMLEVDEDSRLGKEMLLGGVRYGALDTPSDDATADFYELAVERLAAMGIARYEISNFARPGFESRHNLKYWKLEPYVGFGADAHSFDGRTRRQNPESIEDYLSGAGPGGRRAPPLRRAFLHRPAPLRRHTPRPRGMAPLRRAHPPLPGRRPARNRRRHAAPHQPRRAALQ